jgi:hypothetical protein
MAFEFVHGVHLRRTDERIDEVEALVERCGGRAGVEGLLADDRTQGLRRMRWSPPTGLKVNRAWSWERRDNTTRRWWPQGITTSADAYDSSRIADREVIAVSWYSKAVEGVGKGTRISFIDFLAKTYRHVLLVVPTVVDGQVTLAPLKAHAGGIVWAGPFLYVAGTRKGIHVFRMEDLVRVPDELFVEDHTRIGPVDDSSGRLATYGYRYVLPLRFAYHAAYDEGHEPLRYSFLSLDRSNPRGPQLVAGEYGRGKQSTRLARFPLEPETFHLVSGEDGYSRPLLLEDKGERGMQGATIVHDTWYVTSSRGPTCLGSLYVGSPGHFREHRWALPVGPEDIAYVPQNDTLWSVSEHPWRRWVFRMKRSRF